MSFRSALLVEDEPQLAQTLKIALRKLEIPARHATTLADARRRATEEAPELILLDRQLPDGDGIELCQELRAHGYSGAILMLTAKGLLEDRVEGLECGADDYLPKPFAWTELEARIRALSRRRPLTHAAKPADLLDGNVPQLTTTGAATPALWQLEPDRLRIHGQNGWAELTPLEFKLASKLILARGAIVTRDELLKDVWGFTLLPKTRTVDHFLGRLRKRLEANSEQPAHFLTVRGAGYRFEAGT